MKIVELQRAAAFAPLLVLLGPVLVCAQAPKSSPAAVDQYGLAAQYQKLEQFDLAAEEWEKLIDEFPDDPLVAAGRHYAGVCQFQLGNYEAAVKAFEEFVANHPQHELLEPTLTNLGLAAYNQARAAEGDEATELFERAIAAFDRQRKQFPEGKLGAESAFYRGEALYALGQTAEAESAYANWLEKYPDSPLAPNVRLALGATQIELDKTQAAIDTLDALLDADPPQDVAGQALMRMGDAYIAAAKYDQAAAQYAKAIESYGEAIDVEYANRARVGAMFRGGDFVGAAAGYEELGDLASAGKSYYQAGDHTKAADLLAKAYQASNGDADLAHWWVRSLLEAGQAEAALAAANQAIEQAKSPVLLLDRADAMYAVDSKRAESVLAYLKAAEAAAGDGELAGESRALAAATALEVGDFKTAKREAKAVIEAAGGAVFDATVTLAEAQLQSGEAAEAATTFAQLMDAASEQQRRDLAVRLAWAQSTADDEAGVVSTLSPIIDSLTGSNAQQAQLLLGRAQFRTGNHAAALEVLAPIAALDPPGQWTPEAMLLLARSQAATGDNKAALATLTKLVDSAPAAQLAAQAYYRRGEVAQALEDTAAAIRDYDLVTSRWPDHALAPYAAYRAATVAMKSGELADAAQRFARLVEQYPDHALAREAQFGQVTCLARDGKHGEALEVLDALPSGVDDPRIALARGTSLAGMEKWNEAIESFEAAATAPGEFADRDRAKYELAWAYREAGKSAEARRAFQDLATQHPESSLVADALFRVGESQYEAGEYAAAAESFRSAGDRSASEVVLSEKAQHLAGWALHKQGDQAAAAEAFAAQLAAHPDGELAADAKWMIGESRFAAGEFSRALEAYQAAGDAKPMSESLAPLGMLHAGQAAGQLEKWQQAADWLKRAAGEYPKYEGRNELAYELGWALTKLGQRDEALPLLEKVAERDNSPIGARARFVVGELQFADKQYEEALRSFFKVAYGYGDRQAPETYHPWQAESLFEAARCLEQLDRNEAAKKLYGELVDRFPDAQKTPLAKKRLAELGG